MLIKPGFTYWAIRLILPCVKFWGRRIDRKVKIFSRACEFVVRHDEKRIFTDIFSTKRIIFKFWLIRFLKYRMANYYSYNIYICILLYQTYLKNLRAKFLPLPKGRDLYKSDLAANITLLNQFSVSFIFSKCATNVEKVTSIKIGNQKNLRKFLTKQ